MGKELEDFLGDVTVMDFKEDYVDLFFFKQKAAYEIGTGDWSSDVCSSDLPLDSSVPIQENIGTTHF